MVAKTKAPEGTIWLCHACGKLSRDRFEDTERAGWDESCMLRAVLISEASIERNERGKVIKAKAIPVEEWPDSFDEESPDEPPDISRPMKPPPMLGKDDDPNGP